MSLLLPRDAVRCPACDVVQYAARDKCRHCGAVLKPVPPVKPTSAKLLRFPRFAYQQRTAA